MMDPTKARPKILEIVEIPFDEGGVRFRYERYLPQDGDRWVRHGLFQAFHPNGQLATEGQYDHGHEEGVWRDYHHNGQIAAQGRYRVGEKVGRWRYWSEDGQLEEEETC